MDEIEERSPRPDDPTDLVARLRARLAEHEPEPRRRFDLAGRARDALARLRMGITRRLITRRTRVGLIVGVVAFATAVVAAVVVLGGTGSPAREPSANPTASTVARPTTTRVPATSADGAPELLARLPATWRATCRVAGAAPTRQPRAALTCAPAAGIRVDVRRASAGSTARMVAQVATGNPPGPGGAACARDHEGLRNWSASAHPERVLGRVACVRSHGEARLVWSVDHDSLVLDATRSDGDLARLFGWWVASTF